ncbi:MarR family transcriptional regulator [Paenibacillus sp. P26]|nr:MarR family transcriptional regulator [Paenibacillus sp. P26]UUZ91575.1 MarR family transcriptional regulator [Paenibacillus sp. P25]
MDEEKAPPGWEWNKGPIGRLVKVCYIALRREMEELLRPEGLTHTQWSALGIIYHDPGITSSELEHILMIERPSVTSLINGMVKKGWAVRKDHPEDARYKRIFLTEEGLELAARTQHFAQMVEDRVKESMPAAELETLKALLVQLAGLFGERERK